MQRRYRYLDPTAGSQSEINLSLQVAVLTNLCMVARHLGYELCAKDMGIQSRTLNCLLRCPCFRPLVTGKA